MDNEKFAELTRNILEISCTLGNSDKIRFAGLIVNVVAELQKNVDIPMAATFYSPLFVDGVFDNGEFREYHKHFLYNTLTTLSGDLNDLADSIDEYVQTADSMARAKDEAIAREQARWLGTQQIVDPKIPK